MVFYEAGFPLVPLPRTGFENILHFAASIQKALSVVPFVLEYLSRTVIVPLSNLSHQTVLAVTFSGENSHVLNIKQKSNEITTKKLLMCKYK